MSYFGEDEYVYIIIPKTDFNQSMLNQARLISHIDGGVSKNSLKQTADKLNYLVKLKPPIHDMFNGYAWLNKEDVRKKRTRDEI